MKVVVVIPINFYKRVKVLSAHDYPFKKMA